jgi:hypothetical protein|tara:strand:- start:31 stop:261 length:231 start_codon:yes stop_codon:yes gene_type:complete
MRDIQCWICGVDSKDGTEIKNHRNRTVWVCAGDIRALDPMGDGFLTDPSTGQYPKGLYTPEVLEQNFGKEYWTEGV